VACLSEHSVSKEGDVQRELREALDVAQNMPEGSVFIIPLRIEPCSPPRRMANLQWINLFEDGGYQKLLDALAIVRIRNK
jgi:hypothetical protein